MVTVEDFCGRCGKEPNARLTCDGCENMQYCSVECRQADCDTHALLCEYFQDFQLRPEQEARRAIFLPADADRPRFSWVPVDGGSISDTVLGVAGPAGKHMNHSVCIRLDMNYLNDTYPSQTCLENLIGAQSASFFRGPITLYGTKSGNSKTVVDLDTRDLSLALVALKGLWDRKKDTPRLHTLPRFPITVSAVKFTPRTGKFEDVQISVKHSIFTQGTISAISEKFGPGLPTLKMYQVPDPDFPAQRLEVALNGMPPPAYLDMDISVHLGRLWTRWRNETLVVLIARADGRAFSSRTRSPSTLISQACRFLESDVHRTVRRYSAEEIENDPSAPLQWEKLVKSWYPY